VLAPACTDRTRPHDDHGRRLAQHLCPIQATCDCGEELLIPGCEARVEREYAASERTAIEAGLELDEACFEQALEDLDRLAACDRPSNSGTLCPVYTAHAEVGEACENHDFVPWMTECRAGLSCLQGTCRDLENPQLLYEGEVCSADLGVCAEGLICDSDDTRTCIPSPYWPPVPTGGQCTTPISCVDESYCQPQDPPQDPSEESPGTCTERTPEGQACALPYECTTRCTNGICETLPPKICETLEAWWAREQLLDPR